MQRNRIKSSQFNHKTKIEGHEESFDHIDKDFRDYVIQKKSKNNS